MPNNSIRKYKKFQLKSEVFGTPAFIGCDDLGKAKMSIKKKLTYLRDMESSEKNTLRKVAIQDVIKSLEYLLR